MYTPRFNVVGDEAELRRMVAAARTAWFVTAGADGLPEATFVPIVWGESTVVAHVARVNQHWRHLTDGMPALVIVTGPDAYVSPTWYPSKQVNGRVVPTWNYSAVHLTGTVTVHHDPDWLHAAVSELTDVHEAGRAHPWAVADAPADHIADQLTGIVGLELTVTGVQGKAKLSQNRTEADRRGVVAGLADEPFAGAAEVAARMATQLDG